MEHHELVPVRKWQRLQKNGVDRREHGAVGADLEGQSEDDGRRKRRRFANEPDAGFDVRNGVFDRGDTMHVAQLFFELLPTAEFEHSFAPGFVNSEAVRNFLRNELVDVKAKLGIELVIERAPSLKNVPAGHWQLLLRGLKNQAHCICQAAPIRFLGC
jgi:hypothetical protein